MKILKHLAFDLRLLVFGVIISGIVVGNAILSQQQGYYNESTQVLLNIILTATSIWAGIFWNTKQAEKHATDKWMPAAESALKSLHVMKAIIERRQKKRGQEVEGGKVFEPFLKNGGDVTSANAFLNFRCGECNESLIALKLQIMNSLKSWSVFLDTNCDKQDCNDVNCRVTEFVSDLESVKAEKIITFTDEGGKETSIA
jgi:hypothetical protein